MTSSMISSATVSTVYADHAAPAQASMVAPFTGLKSSSAFPVTRKSNDITSIASNGGRLQCMQVWPPVGLKKFETLSYLPPLSPESLAKEVDYLLRNNWVPCLEFELETGFVYRENHKSPGYYDGRYWTMWKLPMFGCTDSSQVLKELDEAKKPIRTPSSVSSDSTTSAKCSASVSSPTSLKAAKLLLLFKFHHVSLS